MSLRQGGIRWWQHLRRRHPGAARPAGRQPPTAGAAPTESAQRRLPWQLPDLPDWAELDEQAEQDFTGFWDGLARRYLNWDALYTSVLDDSNRPFYKWFDDGLLNASVNCLDRHVAGGGGDRPAIIFEPVDGDCRTLSYTELLEQTSRLANAFRAHGLRKGDRVVIYMPRLPEAMVAMQACARLGIVHCVVSTAYSASLLRERIVELGAAALMTASSEWRDGAEIPLKSTVDEALALGGCDSLRHVFVYERTDAAPAPMTPGRDESFRDLMQDRAACCEPTMVKAEHPLFVLYTSGASGQPKGVQHATAGYLLWAQFTMHLSFDLRRGDIFCCTADLGLPAGHSYLAWAPLALGATLLMFEDSAPAARPEQLWRALRRHACTIFYTQPTVVRQLRMAAEGEASIQPQHFDLASLRLIGTFGEILDTGTRSWFQEAVGRQSRPLISPYWQAETGGHMLGWPASKIAPGTACARPLPGVFAAIVDKTGRALADDAEGRLVYQRPWPAMVRTLWGHADVFRASYFPSDLEGAFDSGDHAMRGVDACWHVTGRVADLINVGGQLLAADHLEAALLANAEWVSQAAVVSRKDARTGEAICAFIVPAGDFPETDSDKAELETRLRAWMTQRIGAVARPTEIYFLTDLPRTASGQIVRRLLRALARGQVLEDKHGALDKPGLLEELQSCREKAQLVGTEKQLLSPAQAKATAGPSQQA